MSNILMLAGVIPAWYQTFYNVGQIILVALIAVFALSILIIIMAQESNADGGSNVITGSSESFYSQNQGSTREGRLKKLIKIFAIAIAVAVILYFVLDVIKASF